MLDLETLKTQRELMEGNEEVCRILDEQIAALESQTVLPELEAELERKIQEHKAKQAKAKELVKVARAELRRMEDGFRAELEISVQDINKLRNEINALKGQETKEQNDSIGIEDILEAIFNPQGAANSVKEKIEKGFISPEDFRRLFS